MRDYVEAMQTYVNHEQELSIHELGKSLLPGHSAAPIVYLYHRWCTFVVPANEHLHTHSPPPSSPLSAQPP